MKLDYTYRKTAKIKDYLERLTVARKVIEIVPTLPHIEDNLRRKSLLKSSLFSARIEGNPITYEEISFSNENIKTKDINKIEVFNILAAIRWLRSNQPPAKLTKNLILKLHKLVMKDLSNSPGFFRKDPSAIFNQAGIAVYFAPPPNEIPDLILKLIKQTNLSKEPTPVKAALFHFAFEKIHPFLDGNGRVGRLLSVFILQQGDFGFRGLVPLEEEIEQQRQNYYDLLQISKKEITEFVEFFLEVITIQAEKIIKELKEVKKELPEDTLLPRRQEILAIIKTHKIVSFDFIRRRFIKIPESTLHYDLKQLIKNGFIKKLGSTRGVLYKQS